MLDHTYKGVPISQVSDADLADILDPRTQFEFRYPGDNTLENVWAFCERARIEVLIRARGWRRAS
jgi:hypothetical protein